MDKYLVNPELGNNHVGVDDEGLYIDIGILPQPNVHWNAEKDEDYVLGTDSESDTLTLHTLRVTHFHMWILDLVYYT